MVSQKITFFLCRSTSGINMAAIGLSLLKYSKELEVTCDEYAR